MIKRYLLFSGSQYYPGGGWEDYRGTFDSVDEMIAMLNNRHKEDDWAHGIDLFNPLSEPATDSMLTDKDAHVHFFTYDEELAWSSEKVWREDKKS